MRYRIIGAAFALAFVGGVPVARAAITAPTASQPFSAKRGPWTTPIPARPVLDANSDAMVAALSGRSPVADLYAYGVPIFDAWAGTRRASVSCQKRWGTCPVGGQVPMPWGAKPSSGSDRAMVVIDHASQASYEFWQAQQHTATAWTAAWGSVVPLGGPGTPGAAVGAGVSRLAGIIRASEITAGEIDHALVVSSNDTCAIFRYPATKSDGATTGASCLPEGARLQLDPAVDVAALAGLSPAARAVARAMQVYGAYVVDTGGASLAFIFEDPVGKPDPYPAAGLPSDFARLTGPPWTQLRVLASWDGMPA